jgi:Protein of unknown function (DUF2934)
MNKSRRKTGDSGSNTATATLPSPTETAPQSLGDTTAADFDRDRIAARAYELYLARGGGDGMDMEDWLVAERELRGASESNDDR